MLHSAYRPGLRPTSEASRASVLKVVFGSACIGLAVFLFNDSPAHAQSFPEQYRGSFRPGHNITVGLGIQQSRWSLELSGLEKPLTTERFNLLASGSYGFHFQVYQRIGLVLGTGLHVVVDRTIHNGFKPNFGLMLPSILGGVVIALGQEFRLLLLGELSAAAYPYSNWRGAETGAFFEGGVLDHVALSSQLDWGLLKRNVFSLIAGWRLAGEQLVGEKIILSGEGTSFPRMRHEGWFLLFGITRQVTETLTGIQDAQ